MFRSRDWEGLLIYGLVAVAVLVFLALIVALIIAMLQPATLTCYEATGDLRIVTIQWNNHTERFTAHCLDFDTETVAPCALVEAACPEDQGE